MHTCRHQILPLGTTQYFYIFVNNSAKVQVGGMIIYDTTVIVEDNASMIFTNNIASKVGAMALLLSTLYVRNNVSITFIKNSATTAESGAVETVFSDIYFEDNAHCIFVQNSAKIAAGAMALWSSELNMKHNTNITFIDNSAIVNEEQW